MKKSIHVIEHTPIYDLSAYEQRQKKRKHIQLRKQILETLCFICISVLMFSILFLGE